MRFDQPRCPECNEDATHILERLLCHTPLNLAGGDVLEWNEEETSEVLWDSSEPAEGEEKDTYTLHCCGCRKSWDVIDFDSWSGPPENS